MNRHLTKHAVLAFRRRVYAHWHKHGRSFPWRKRITPYRVFVSEVMLQQTQAARVAPVFEVFVKRFPSFAALARSPLARVMRAWQGLGYNRRALYLKKAAQTVMRNHKGKLPREAALLIKLPGIGPATAGSIAAFAFNKPAVFIETNIRSVFLHHFFGKRRNVSDRELIPLIEQTLDCAHPRRWYSALMDWGATLKVTRQNPSRRSRHHLTQKPFQGSSRQLRGSILRYLVHVQHAAASSLHRSMRGFSGRRIDRALRELAKEGIVVRHGVRFSIAP